MPAPETVHLPPPAATLWRGADVLQLVRLAGNRAVAGVLDPRSTVLQRTPETDVLDALADTLP